jgi:hypothetical protein
MAWNAAARTFGGAGNWETREISPSKTSCSVEENFQGSICDVHIGVVYSSWDVRIGSVYY